MQRLLALIVKEFKQIMRDKTNIGIVFVVPFVQLLILGSAITMDVSAVKLVFVDEDQTQLSRDIYQKFTATNTFIVQGTVSSAAQGIRLLDTNNTKAVIIIPKGFERDVGLQRWPRLQVLLDGVDGNGSAITAGYIQRVLQAQQPKVLLETRMLYNPQLESKYNIVPGIIAILLTMIMVFLTSINLVREKEMGTLEQLSVTPIRKSELILGKVLPVAMVGLLLFTMGIISAAVIFHIYCAGNLLLLYGLAIIYMFTTLGLGIFFSTVSQTQQQAMFFAWFFSIFSIMLSGFFVPIENMPLIIQGISCLNPTRYFIEIVRGIYLKADGFSLLWTQCVAMIIFGVTVLSLSIARFQKRIL